MNGMESDSFGRAEFSCEEQAAINKALQQRLGPNFISQRPAGRNLGNILFKPTISASMAEMPGN